ncbi:MAG: hypothetical protein V3R24_01600 [Gemmatimonadales bacterium]
MGMRPVYGHDDLLNRLGGSIATGRFPQVSLFTGPRGAGKQRVALWVAQGLLCEAGGEKPCGACRSCRQAAELIHPDLHWFVPIPRPKVADAKKQIDAAQELLAGIMAERRAEPLYSPADGMLGYPIAAIRLLHRVVAVSPFSARCKVIVLGDAERLVIQEASPEAANALLKVLEEPPADTTIILTAERPDRLLPTVRSRLVPLGIRRVSDEAVESFLRVELKTELAPDELQRRVFLAEGCIGRALSAEDDAEPAQAASRFLDAVRSGAGGWARRAFRQPPWAARGAFSSMLDALALSLRSQLATEGNLSRGDLRRTVEALKKVEETRTAARGNVNPQLALAVLGQQLEGLT